MLLGLVSPLIRRDRWKSILVCNLLLPPLVFYLGIDIPHRVCWENGHAELRSIYEPSWKHFEETRKYTALALTLECNRHRWRFRRMTSPE
jgi:hypothetical protein